MFCYSVPTLLALCEGNPPVTVELPSQMSSNACQGAYEFRYVYDKQSKDNGQCLPISAIVNSLTRFSGIIISVIHIYAAHDGATNQSILWHRGINVVVSYKLLTQQMPVSYIHGIPWDLNMAMHDATGRCPNT